MAVIQGVIPITNERIVIPFARGEQGLQGVPGPQGPPGTGVPTGGTTGQVLAKASNTSLDIAWTSLTLDGISGLLSIAKGGTGASTASSALANLGGLPLTGGTLTGSLIVPDEGYSTSWNASLQVPTKNAVYDKLESLTLDNLGDVVVSSPGFGQVLKYNGTEWTNDDETGGSGGDASVVSFTVSQTAHGFAVGNILKNAGTANTYAKAQANSGDNAEVVGIVTEVTNANNFVMTTSGIITQGVPAQAAGTVMFLSPSTAGALTATEPTTVGDVSKPIAIVLESGAKMLFNNFRGELLMTPSTGGGGGGGSPIIIKEVDGSPLVNDVTTIRVTNGTLTDDGSGQVTIDTGGSGDASGPSSSTTNAIATFADTTGKLLQNGLATIDGSGNVNTPGTVTSTGAGTFGSITTSGVGSLGSLTLGTDLPVSEGGTGASTALAARTNLLAQAKAFYTVGTNASDDYVTDGTADEVQINQAITDANAAGGGIVYLKPGTYTIAAAVSILSNVMLVGAGNTTTIIKKVASASGIAGIQALSRSNFYISDLKIDGNRTNGATGRGLNIASSSSGLVERVYLVDAVEGFKTQSATDIKFRDCIADGNYEWNYYQYDGTRIKVHHCQSLNAKAGSFEGFGMAFYHNNTGCEAIGNYVYNPAHNGIQVNSGSATSDVVGVVLRDNEVVNAGHRGIQLTDDGNTFHVKKASVANNRVTGSTNKGIYLNNVYDSSVTGNKSYSNTSEDGICYDTCTNIYSNGNFSSGNNVGLRTLSSTRVIISDIVTSNTTNYSLDANAIRLGPEDIVLDGDAARSISPKRITTGASAGVNLTVQAGGATSSGTDLNGGNLLLAAGIATGNNSSRMEFQVVPNGQGAGTTDRSPLSVMYLSATGTNNQRGRLAIGTNGVGAADGITLSGNTGHQLAMNRHTTSNTAGNSLTIQSGGTRGSATSTDKAAGDLILSTGVSTGTGTSKILLKTADVGTSGTSDNTINTRVQVDNTGMQVTGSLTLSTPLALGQGGTGATTLTGVLKGNGTSAITGSASLNDISAPTTSFSMNAQKLTGLADPTSAQEATTKAYVDSVAQGLDAKDSVRLATTVAGTLATSFENGDTIDGVVLATGDRILIKNQASGAENGIYTVNASGAPTRATDADSSGEVTSGMFTFVTAGTANANTGWVLTTSGTITLGSTPLTFAQFSAATSILGGAGLTLTGNTLDVVGTTNRITANADSIDIAATYVGQTSITTLGTIASGVWNGTTIAVANGGTGATTLTGILKGNGTSAVTAVTAPSGTIVGDTDSQILTNKTLTSPTLTTPTIADFTNANHTHVGSTSGGTVSHTNLSNIGTNTHAQIDTHIAATGTSVHGLGSISTQSSSSVSITGGSVTGITDLAVADGGTGQSTYTDGQLLIGNSSNSSLAKATLTAGSGISITNGNGSITVAATGGGGSNYRTLVTLGSDVASTASTAFQNITGMSFSVTSGTTYRFYALLLFTCSVATIGLRASLTSPAVTICAYNTRVPLALTGSAANDYTNGQISNDAGSASTSSVSTAGNLLVMEGIIKPSASGTVQLRFAPETATAGGITIKAGSSLEYW